MFHQLNLVMAQSRKSLICLENTPYYHCVTRCVRKSFLCGFDKKTGQNYEYRKAWIEKRIHFLAEVFSIKVCAYAVMSNHIHLVLYVDKNTVQSWSTKMVLCQWHKLHKGSALTRKFLQNEKLSESELEMVEKTAELYRQRLFSISWFMRDLNEFIARKANKEDDCTGRFWEGRFFSQALLDERAVIACMAYVDLNPIRAGIAQCLNTSQYTSIRRRIKLDSNGEKSVALVPFSEQTETKLQFRLSFSFNNYCELLVDSISVCNKAEHSHALAVTGITSKVNKFGFKEYQWQALVKHFGTLFGVAIGSPQALNKFKQLTARKRIMGMGAAKLLFR